LNEVIFEKRDTLDDSVSLNVSCHGLNGKKLIVSFFILNFVVSNSPQRYSKMLIEISVIVINNVKTVGFLGSVHVAELFVEVGVCLQNV
jgi:hypothetical protein